MLLTIKIKVVQYACNFKERIGNMRMSRSVYCFDTGITYNSLSQAARDTGCSKSHISMVCNGELKTAKGMRFRFADGIKKSEVEKTSKRKYVRHGAYLFKKKRYKEVTWINQQPIYCWTNGKSYKSVSEASRDCYISRSTILRNCKINEGVENDDDLKSTSSGLIFTFEE